MNEQMNIPTKRKYAQMMQLLTFEFESYLNSI